MPIVNDIQSKLNRTQVHSIVIPKTEEEILQAIRQAEHLDLAVSIAGGQHSMGGQQFGTDTMLLDLRQFKAIVNFDRQQGLLTLPMLQLPLTIVLLLHRLHVLMNLSKKTLN